MEIKLVDLFCGVGGIRLGFDRAAKKLKIKTETVFACDLNEKAASVYKKNFSINNFHGNIRDITNYKKVIGKHDINYVLDEIRDATNKFFFFCIDLIPAVKQTYDGRNAHFLIAPSEWWISQLKIKFNVVSALEVGELESGEKYPIRLFGCATNSMKHFKAMNTFLENVEIAQKRWIWTKKGVVLKDYE